MQSQSAEYAPSETNVSITGSYLVTAICSKQLMNSLLTTIAGDLIEALARERHVPMLGRYRENRPRISNQNRFSAGCIMCTNGQPDNTDGVFAPYKPYVKSNKNDARDAEAICEAMSRPNMRFVTVKTVDQQDIQATHRIREELKVRRTAKANQIRGLVAEYGLVAPKHLSSLRAAIPCWLEDAENGLTHYFRSLLQGLWDDLLALDDRMCEMDKTIKRLVKDNEDCVRLQKLRGVGPMTSTAMIATVGDARQYRKSRQMAASIGITRDSIVRVTSIACLELVSAVMFTCEC